MHWFFNTLNIKDALPVFDVPSPVLKQVIFCVTYNENQRNKA